MNSAVGSVGKVTVEHARELELAFLRLRKEVLVGLKAAIIDAAEPIKTEAEANAVADIRNIGSRWSRMRIGVTPQFVYIVPASRRRRGSPRPNLAGLLQPAMEQAADDHEDSLLARIDELVTVSAARSGLL